MDAVSRLHASVLAAASCIVMLASASRSTHAAEALPAEATALANALQLSTTMRDTLTARIKARAGRDPKAQQELECIERLDLGVVNTAVAESVAQGMTAAEMNEARAFFETPLGQKYLRFSSAMELIKRELPTSKPVEWLTDAETDEVQKFTRTEAGTKLMLQILQSSEARDRLFKRVSPVLQPCAPQRSVAEHFELLTPLPKSAGSEPEAPRTSTPASLASVRTLIQQMREDEIMLTMLRERVTKDPRVSAWDHACVEKLKPSDFTDAIATKVVDKLTAEDVAEGTTFYRSAAGKKFVQVMFDNIRLGDDPDRIARAMTADEIIEMRKFVDRPGGKKIYVDQVIQQNTVIDSVGRQFVALMTKCRAEQGR